LLPASGSGIIGRAIGKCAAGAEGSWDLIIEGARLLDREGALDIAVKDGMIAAIEPRVEGNAARRIEAGGGLVTLSFTEPHFHLDKCLSRDLLGATKPSEAFARAREVKSQFTVGDVEERASKALTLAIANGIGHLRAMVDVDFATKLISLEGVLRARERYAHAIEVEIAAFPQEGIVTDPEAPALLKTALEMGADLLGGLPEFESPRPRASRSTCIAITSTIPNSRLSRCSWMGWWHAGSSMASSPITATRSPSIRTTRPSA
jgi:cytosine deaminase